MMANDDTTTGCDSLCVGYKIEAYSRGLGRFCSGSISRVYDDDSCDIVFDNGEKDLMVHRNLIKTKTESTNMDDDCGYSDDEDF